MRFLSRYSFLPVLTLGVISDVLAICPSNQHFDFDEDIAKLSLVYNSAAYVQDPAVANWTFENPECNNLTEGFIITETYTGQDTEAFGFIGHDPVNQRIVAAFKGSSDLSDWVTNLHTLMHYHKSCAPDPDPPEGSFPWQPSTDFGMGWSGEPGVVEGGSRILGKENDGGDVREPLMGHVHFGFCHYYQSIVKQGFTDRILLLAEEYPSYKLLITGHSLGGAAAAICAADLTQRQGIAKERVMLYTMGEPRAGDGIFAKGLKDSVGTAYRLVHHRDIVPHLSLCCHEWLGKCKPDLETCPYQHCSEVLYDNDMGPEDGYIVCNSSIGEDYSCDPQSVDLSIVDHLTYYQKLVGLYCGSAPSEAETIDIREREEANWAEFDREFRLRHEALQQALKARNAL